MDATTRGLEHESFVAGILATDDDGVGSLAVKRRPCLVDRRNDALGGNIAEAVRIREDHLDVVAAFQEAHVGGSVDVGGAQHGYAQSTARKGGVGRVHSTILSPVRMDSRAASATTMARVASEPFTRGAGPGFPTLACFTQLQKSSISAP